MAVFNYFFMVNAPLSAVSAFHHDTRILKKLTPPPLFVQIHQFEPLAENSRGEFTLWAGPFPIPWIAIHTHVSQQGFTDTQAKGPMKRWIHTHRFSAVSATQTQVHEHIEYEHHPDLRGFLTRFLFNKPGLWILFTYRKLITRWHTNNRKS